MITTTNLVQLDSIFFYSELVRVDVDSMKSTAVTDRIIVATAFYVAEDIIRSCGCG